MKTEQRTPDALAEDIKQELIARTKKAFIDCGFSVRRTKVFYQPMIRQKQRTGSERFS